MQMAFIPIFLKAVIISAASIRSGMLSSDLLEK